MRRGDSCGYVSRTSVHPRGLSIHFVMSDRTLHGMLVYSYVLCKTSYFIKNGDQRNVDNLLLISWHLVFFFRSREVRESCVYDVNFIRSSPTSFKTTYIYPLKGAFENPTQSGRRNPCSFKRHFVPRVEFLNAPECANA